MQPEAAPLYDGIGPGYARHRRADDRLVRGILALLDLDPGAAVADVGAGTGNYGRALAERGFSVKAVEPSLVMREQALAHDRVEWLDGRAEALPLQDGSVDAVICILAVHHFSSTSEAYAEMARVCPEGPVLFLTFDPREAATPWLAHYFPGVWNGTFTKFPAVAEFAGMLGAPWDRPVEVRPFLVPWDLDDSFLAVGWRRPELYLDRGVRACISAFATADPGSVARGVSKLGNDLRDGTWEQRFGRVREANVEDWGYRFVVACPVDRHGRSVSR